MAMLAASLKSLKKKTTELIKDAVKADSGPSGDFDAQWDEASAGGPSIVYYKIQNGDKSDRDGAAFMLPERGAGVTAADVRACFPVPGNFHFRFKVPTPGGAFAGFAYVDLANDAQQVPFFRGHISMKALRVPDEVSAPSHEPVPGSNFAGAPQASLFGGAELTFDDGPAEGPPRHQDATRAGGPGGPGPSPLRSPASSPLHSPPRSHPESPSRSPPPPLARQPADMIDTASPGNPAATRFAPAQPPPPGRASAASLPDDLIDCGMGGASGYPKSGGPPLRPPQVAAPAPAPVKIPDRAQLVAERERKEKQRVEDTVNRHAELRDKEAKSKSDKLDASNKLCAEMDQWARTPDGQSWKDVRTLLSTMHTVLWPGSGWQPISLADMVANESNIKKFYRKAIILTHPDRHQDAPADVQVRADRIFQALNEAFKVAGNS